jgi:hypothetical protein
VAVGLAGGGGDRGDAAQVGERGLRAQPVGVVPDGGQQLAGDLEPDAELGQHLRGGTTDERSEFGVSGADLRADLVTRLVTRTRRDGRSRVKQVRRRDREMLVIVEHDALVRRPRTTGSRLITQRRPPAHTIGAGRTRFSTRTPTSAFAQRRYISKRHLYRDANVQNSTIN